METRIINATVGQIIFNRPIPQDLGFVDRTNPEKIFDLEVTNVAKKSELKKIIDRYPEQRSAHEWAFRYVGHFKEVAVQLSGMSTQEMVEDNLRIFDDVKVGALSERDLRMIGRLRNTYLKRMPIPCTGCAYCVPCPKDVRIPKIFATSFVVMLIPPFLLFFTSETPPLSIRIYRFFFL